MSKNLTRKGLAFGALVALGASVIAGAPASAAGLTDTSFVSLAPETGTEYAIIAGAGNVFSLAANEASTVQAGTLKFLVSSDSVSLSVNGNSAATIDILTNADDTDIEVGTSVATTIAPYASTDDFLNLSFTDDVTRSVL